MDAESILMFSKTKSHQQGIWREIWLQFHDSQRKTTNLKRFLSFPRGKKRASSRPNFQLASNEIEEDMTIFQRNLRDSQHLTFGTKPKRNTAEGKPSLLWYHSAHSACFSNFTSGMRVLECFVVPARKQVVLATVQSALPELCVLSLIRSEKSFQFSPNTTDLEIYYSNEAWCDAKLSNWWNTNQYVSLCSRVVSSSQVESRSEVQESRWVTEFIPSWNANSSLHIPPSFESRGSGPSPLNSWPTFWLSRWISFDFLWFCTWTDQKCLQKSNLSNQPPLEIIASQAWRSNRNFFGENTQVTLPFLVLKQTICFEKNQVSFLFNLIRTWWTQGRDHTDNSSASVIAMCPQMLVFPSFCAFSSPISPTFFSEPHKLQKWKTHETSEPVPVPTWAHTSTAILHHAHGKVTRKFVSRQN